MCYFDADPCDYYEVVTFPAPEPTKCGVCETVVPVEGWITKHEWALEVGEDEDGSPDEERPIDATQMPLCFACAEALERFRKSHGTHPSPDWFEEALRGCYDGASKADRDAHEWRDVHAGIIRRTRQASRVA